ncbi:MAG TPA: hypothetical protein VH082_11945 [Rudaea sp.]|nr:hypothetical protein [Rudaea sp.]
MDDQTRLAAIEKSLTTLKVLMACVIFMNLAALVWIFAPLFLLPARMISASRSSEEFPSWQELSFDQRLSKASVIVITENRKQDETVRGYVTEVLKRAPHVQFAAKIGDEVPDQRRTVKPNTVYGDGAIVFYVGAMPTTWASSEIYDGTIPALKNMSVDDFRRAVAAAN